mmetsp:Transcript_58004/g.96184  ORF Transcript_58004/g.96184 Transcript_58004/m.96184 type:complete len:388 (+) Transcript_58004:32-1195(+)
MAYWLEPGLFVVDFLCFLLALILRTAFDVLFFFTSPIWYLVEAYQSASPRCPKQFTSILITGASSGIGKATAIEFAARNPNCTLFLLGRNEERLQGTKVECEQTMKRCNGNNGQVFTHCVDMTDQTKIAQVICTCDDQAPIDLLFANAGISHSGAATFFDRFEEMVTVNIMGTFNCVFPALKRMLKRQRGHIVLNASIASYQPLFGSTSAFSATKAFIRFLGQTLTVSLKYYNIDMSVVQLGWVDTQSIPDAARKWSVSAENAASVIANGIYRNKSTIHFPFHFSFAMWYVGGLHPVLNSCIAWLSMPNANEANHVFANYLPRASAHDEMDHRQHADAVHHGDIIDVSPKLQRKKNKLKHHRDKNEQAPLMSADAANVDQNMDDNFV